jgi:SAM-dependent methyltransferase
MRHAEAREMLQGAVARGSGTWADLGAGSGTFTVALAQLVGEQGRVIAVDDDPAAMAALRRLSEARASGRAPIVAVQGDIGRLADVPVLGPDPWDGAVLANVLHSFPDPGRVLTDVALRLVAGGSVVVIEYDRVAPSPWVPYPIPADRLVGLAGEARLGEPEVVSERPSRFGGRLYCAVLRTTGLPPGAVEGDRPSRG